MAKPQRITIHHSNQARARCIDIYLLHHIENFFELWQYRQQRHKTSLKNAQTTTPTSVARWRQNHRIQGRLTINEQMCLPNGIGDGLQVKAFAEWHVGIE